MPTPHPTVADRLVQHARRLAHPFLSHEGLACGATPFGGFTHDVQPLRSRPFQEWLTRTFLQEHEVCPSNYSLRTATQLLQALATDPDTPRRSIDLRVSSTGDPLRPASILLDLANAQGDAVEITASGWSVTTPPIAFRRSRTAQPLPEPSTAAGASTQSRFTLPGFAPHPACLAWLLAAFRPAGPYPILILHGPHSSGKTTLARMLRALIDPASSPFCRPARNQRDLLRLAWNNYVLAFDHATNLPTDVADSLCRLSSGAGFAFDEMADGSDALTRIQRPIILTTPDLASAARIRNHAITVHLRAIAPTAMRAEADLLDEFQTERPALLARLCTALCVAQVSRPVLQVPRFIDAAQCAVAAAPTLGIPANEMEAALAPDQFIHHIAEFLNELGAWEGTPTALYTTLQARATPNLPATPARLIRKLQQSPLAAYSIQLHHSRDAAKRKIRLTVTESSTVIKARSA